MRKSEAHPIYAVKQGRLFLIYQREVACGYGLAKRGEALLFVTLNCTHASCSTNLMLLD